MYFTNKNQFIFEQMKEAQVWVGDALDLFATNQWNAFLDRMGPHPLLTVPFWRQISRQRGNEKSKNVDMLLVDGKMVTKKNEIAEIFANRLEQVFKDGYDSNFNSDN